MADEPAVVLDSGTGYTKVGFAGDDEPKTIFKSLVYKQQNQEYLVGEEVPEKSDTPMECMCPIEFGMIKDWDLMHHIWKYCYSGLV